MIVGRACGVVICLMVTASASLSAQKIFKRYPFESGMIYYDINTTGISKGFSTKVSGIARLVFDKWGARELKEEDATEIQQGDFNETRDRRSMSMIDGGTVNTVDFDEQIIYKSRDRSLDLAMARGDDLSNENIQLLKEMKGAMTGTDTVAGFPCDVWKVKDQTICLYKGVPLRITIDGPGFHSERIAVHASFNKPIPESQFALPDFPVKIDEEYTSNAAAATRTEDYIASAKDLYTKLKSMGIDPKESNATFTPEQEKAIINTLGARYLEKQKRLLPKLLVALGGAKKCLEKAKNPEEAKACIKPVNRINEELGDKTENFDFSNWSDEKRRMIEDALADEINYLKVTIDCVQKHDKTTDVIQCTEGNLGDLEQTVQQR